MSQPTTRAGRFLERRKRYERRADADYVQGWDYFFDPVKGYNVRGNRVVSLDVGPKQPIYLKRNCLPVHGMNHPPVPGVAWALQEVPRQGTTPRIEILNVGGVPWPFLGYSTRGALVGYHVRKMHARRHKQGRRDGAWRKEWGARVFSWVNGFWPDWDPLGRHPDLQDINNGASFIPWSAFPGPGQVTP